MITEKVKENQKLISLFDEANSAITKFAYECEMAKDLDWAIRGLRHLSDNALRRKIDFQKYIKF